MILMFKLSMPGCNSWNGKWTGEDKLYVQFRSLRKAPACIGFYTYNFGDGWRAGVDVTQVTSAEKVRLARKSAGFYGYDWMIESILQNGRIIPRKTL